MIYLRFTCDATADDEFKDRVIQMILARAREIAAKAKTTGDII